MAARKKQPKKRSVRPKIFSKQLAKALSLPTGDAGFLVLVGVAIVSFLLAGGIATFSQQNYGIQGNLITPVPSYPSHTSNQLHTLGFLTVTPSPTPNFTATPNPTLPNPTIPPNPTLPHSNFCTTYGNIGGSGGDNNQLEPIVAGYYPGPGQTVLSGGQIKVWVSDENPPCVGTGEVADPNTGVITTPGNHTEQFKNGYLWEPALYIGTLSGSGGTPHFPTMIKGTYNNAPKSGNDCSNNVHQLRGPAIDPIQSNGLHADDNSNQAEYIWDVNSLGLAPGTYPAEFITHDGDDDQGGYCVTIAIQ